MQEQVHRELRKEDGSDLSTSRQATDELDSQGAADKSVSTAAGRRKASEKKHTGSWFFG